MPYNKIVRESRDRATPAMVAARLSAFCSVQQLLDPALSLSAPHRRELLSISLWKWTEAAGIPPNAKFNVRFATLDHGTSAKVNHEHVLPREWIIDRLLESGKSWREKDLGRFWRKTASPALSPSRSTRGSVLCPSTSRAGTGTGRRGSSSATSPGTALLTWGHGHPPTVVDAVALQMDPPCVELEPGRGAHGGISG